MSGRTQRSRCSSVPIRRIGPAKKPLLVIAFAIFFARMIERSEQDQQRRERLEAGS